MIEFFLGGSPPTVTHQHQQVTVRNGKPVFYQPDRLKAAREKLTRQLKTHRPVEPIEGAVRLLTKWCFPLNTRHKIDGEYKITRPDTDNLQKMLKDVMTEVGFISGWNSYDAAGSSPESEPMGLLAGKKVSVYRLHHPSGQGRICLSGGADREKREHDHAVHSSA